ncbi:hypothetical protein HMPREF0454_01004 [Hafnia alvei ATCC 51873]|uniref:Uncharacterized protein n=1 Tax=Hafnia alvei ATCC 51873 TaxID=1002364 RepID=G9Y379_HAFAL|nr:hypothetical protein HMPREF0454_01004 [Hafnia alvei ATCC 51873]
MVSRRIHPLNNAIKKYKRSLLSYLSVSVIFLLLFGREIYQH